MATTMVEMMRSEEDQITLDPRCSSRVAMGHDLARIKKVCGHDKKQYNLNIGLFIS